MKKLWMILPAALAFNVGSAFAATACGTGTIDFATWTTQGFSCEIGDKIFSNFAAGTTPANSTLQFGQAGDNYTINLQNTATNGFATSFSLSYDIAIDFLVAPNANYRIVAVTGGMQDARIGGSNATLTKTLSGGGSGVVTVNDVNGVITPNPVLGLQASSLHVVDAFTYTSGNITNIANTFGQADTSVPEPLTLSLMGGGLVAVGLLRRRIAR